MSDFGEFGQNVKKVTFWGLIGVEHPRRTHFWVIFDPFWVDFDPLHSVFRLLFEPIFFRILGLFLTPEIDFWPPHSVSRLLFDPATGTVRKWDGLRNCQVPVEGSKSSLDTLWRGSFLILEGQK